MAKTAALDYANVAGVSVTLSAANTLTFKKLDTAISINEKVAWIVNRLEVYFDISLLGATTESATFALTRSNTLTDLMSLLEPAIIFQRKVLRIDYGAAANNQIWHVPYQYDFSTLPGGGLIVPPNPLYLAAVTTGVAEAFTLYARLFYTTLELSNDQFWQLVEAYRMLTS